MSSNAGIDRSASGVPGRLANIDGMLIENLHGIAQAREVEKLQTEIWSANESWVVPSHVLLIVSEYGGILLGARVNGALIGFVLGFLAQSHGKLHHASHMLGVLPHCRHHGVGAALKLHQRKMAIEQGLDLMRWTFDPLEARNAYFNFHKLGTVCRTYHSNYYGPMPDALNRDLPSDRLLVEWHLREIGRRPGPVVAPQTVLRNMDGSPELQIDDIRKDLPISIEVPRDVQSIKRESPDLALSWRLAIRQAFSLSFGKGFQAHDFRDGMYILLPQKESEIEN